MATSVMAPDFEEVFVEDLNAEDVQLPSGRYPLVLQYQGDPWILDRPVFDPEGNVEAYVYVPRDACDRPHVLRVWA